MIFDPGAAEPWKGRVSARLPLLLAAVLSAPGLFTDFWLDEIGALGKAASVPGPLSVFTAIHHDSNHWLVSLWMNLLGPDAPFWTYRLPSFFAGVAAVHVAGLLASASGSSPPLAMLFAATSFPLGFYASEARGYSLAALAGLLAIYALVRWADEGRGRFAALYGLSATLGILSHLSFLIVLVSTLGFTSVLAARGRVRPGRAIAAHLLPLGALAVLYFLDLRYLEIGGGPRVPPSVLLARTASLAMGGGIERPWGLAAICAAVLALELFRRIRRFWPERATSAPSSLLWFFYATVLLLPVWLALVLDPPFLFPRYFLVSVAFVPVLAASLASSAPRVGGLVLIGLWLGTNGLSWAHFAREGRGHYDEALDAILASSGPGRIGVGGDHDFRIGTVFDFYRERMGARAERLEYRPRDFEIWIAGEESSRCERCALLASYPSSKLSGASWRLYRVERKPAFAPREGGAASVLISR